jgi:ankyrin repeat protein
MSQDSYGDTALHAAASKGLESATEMLLNAGAEINALNICGRTPLLRACYGGHDVVV